MQTELRRLESSTGLGGNAVLAIQKDLLIEQKQSVKALSSVDLTTRNISNIIQDNKREFKDLVQMQQTTNKSLSDMSGSLGDKLDISYDEATKITGGFSKLINTISIGNTENKIYQTQLMNDRKAR